MIAISEGFHPSPKTLFAVRTGRVTMLNLALEGILIEENMVPRQPIRSDSVIPETMLFSRPGDTPKFDEWNDIDFNSEKKYLDYVSQVWRDFPGESSI